MERDEDIKRSQLGTEPDYGAGVLDLMSRLREHQYENGVLYDLRLTFSLPPDYEIQAETWDLIHELVDGRLAVMGAEGELFVLGCEAHGDTWEAAFTETRPVVNSILDLLGLDEGHVMEDVVEVSRPFNEVIDEVTGASKKSAEVIDIRDVRNQRQRPKDGPRPAS